MSAQVIDYSTLTDLELNKEIARRLGYKVAQFGERYKRWLIETPEGKYWNDDYGHENTAYEALGFATDANAALELVLSVDYSVSHRTDSYFVHMHGHQLNRWNDKQSFSVSGIAKTFSRAICECWLYLQDAKR